MFTLNHKEKQEPNDYIVSISREVPTSKNFCPQNLNTRTFFNFYSCLRKVLTLSNIAVQTGFATLKNFKNSSVQSKWCKKFVE